MKVTQVALKDRFHTIILLRGKSFHKISFTFPENPIVQVKISGHPFLLNLERFEMKWNAPRSYYIHFENMTSNYYNIPQNIKKWINFLLLSERA